MNGYEMMSESYQKMIERGQINREVGEKYVRVYDFLATCDSDDFCRMVDSGGFNDIIKGFLTLAVNNSGIDEDAKREVLGQVRWVFDEKTAREVLDTYITD